MPENKDIKNQGEPETPETQGKTYTQEEVEEMMSERLTKDEVNDIVQKRVEREKEKAQKELEEQERLAKLSQEERDRELVDKKEKELQEYKSKLERLELENTTKDLLSENEIPLSFINFLIGTNEENSKNNINEFKEVFNKEVENKVNERLAGSPPKTGESAKASNSKADLGEIARKSRIIKE